MIYFDLRLNESRYVDGPIKIHLDESEHVEWSVMEKLTKSCTDSRIVRRAWPSIERKVRVLCSEARGGHVRGLAAQEALTVGGTKNLMWIDIDTYDDVGVNRWLKDQRLFPRGSYRLVSSTTGKSHLYVATDKPLKERWQIGLKKLIMSSMNEDLRSSLDRIYGPESRRVMFLPCISLLGATLPQDLMIKCNETYILPVETIEHICWRG